jgi:hypothetical protein
VSRPSYTAGGGGVGGGDDPSAPLGERARITIPVEPAAPTATLGEAVAAKLECPADSPFIRDTLKTEEEVEIFNSGAEFVLGRVPANLQLVISG